MVDADMDEGSSETFDDAASEVSDNEDFPALTMEHLRDAFGSDLEE